VVRPICSLDIPNVNTVQTCSMRASLTSWSLELKADSNREYLLHGIENGFCLIDKGFDSEPILMRNYASATTQDKMKAEENILEEVKLSRYVITDKKH
jgi:hypothetical protein